MSRGKGNQFILDELADLSEGRPILLEDIYLSLSAISASSLFGCVLS